MDRDEMLKKIMMFTLIVYFVVAIIMVVVKGVFAFIEEEPMLENIMLNIRNYIFALPSIEGKYLVTIFNNIGILRYIIILFWGLFFFESIYAKIDTNLIGRAVFIIIIGTILCVYIKGRLPMGILEGLILSSLLYIFNCIFSALNIKISSKFGKIYYNIVKIVIILCSVLYITMEIGSYFS